MELTRDYLRWCERTGRPGDCTLLGRNAARAFALLALAALGNTAPGLAATVPALPGSMQAAVQAETQVGLRLAAVGEVESVAVANRVIQEGRQFTDSETGNTVHVSGDRVVITDERGEIVTQFKNSRANTQSRIQSGKWVPPNE
jgi:hypothetical protein